MSRLEVRRAGTGRVYKLHGDDGSVTKLIGVTTAINLGVAKGALTTWAARTCADYVIDHLAWVRDPDTKLSEMREAIIKAPDEDRDAAARRGIEVHKLAELIAHKGPEEVEVPDELVGHVRAYLLFRREWQPETAAVERSCWSERYHYAGTFDLIARLPALGLGLIDVKTSRSGPFAESALQLCAYANTEWFRDASDNDVPMPDVDFCAVLWVRSDGYDLIPVETGPDVMRAFLATTITARLLQGVTSKDDPRPVVLPALMPPLVRPQLEVVAS